MSDRAKIILDELCRNLPRLSKEKQIHAIGVLEGMAIMADLSAKAEAAPTPAQEGAN